ncbi:MAG TPA: hypothetical protein VHS05_05725 [Pyrinomonadaceae bacterium]|jgi:hypothetical protein|nr:hypothetical protein [Pyrinomonadaceae bacterium]
MKNIRQDLNDSMRREYRRSDFGKMVRGKYATTQLELAELVNLLITCIGEDFGLKFIHSNNNQIANHKRGDWTYELDNDNQITLRYWLNDFGSIEEPISNPPCVTTPQERSDLQSLLLHHVQALKNKVDAL